MSATRQTRQPVTSSPRIAVPRGGCFEGRLELSGPCRIDGRVKGPVHSDDTLWIGAQAEVDGPLHVENLVVAGTLRGDARVESRIALEATARVTGELYGQRLVLAEGSFLDGTCHAGQRLG
ncbi:MAG: polymer-forming cytoskeletal protein [Myxococcales bacterium]|nr:polymer-forming cytoskeletal protein [Myxococcales bacterium]